MKLCSPCCPPHGPFLCLQGPAFRWGQLLLLPSQQLGALHPQPLLVPPLGLGRAHGGSGIHRHRAQPARREAVTGACGVTTAHLPGVAALITCSGPLPQAAVGWQRTQNTGKFLVRSFWLDGAWTVLGATPKGQGVETRWSRRSLQPNPSWDSMKVNQLPLLPQILPLQPLAAKEGGTTQPLPQLPHSP